MRGFLVSVLPVAALLVVWAALSRGGAAAPATPPGSRSAAPAPALVPLDDATDPGGIPFDVEVVRAGGDVAVLVTRRPFGAPLPRATVAAGDVRGRTDESGACRLSGVPPDVERIEVAHGSHAWTARAPATPRAHPEAGFRGLVADLEAVAPGDSVTIVIPRNGDAIATWCGDSLPAPNRPGSRPVAAMHHRELDGEAAHWWSVVDLAVDEDAGPGEFETSTGGRLAITVPGWPVPPPILPEGYALAPGAPPRADSRMTLTLTGAQASLAVPGAADGAPVMVVARGGGRLLAFASGTLVGGAARLPLSWRDRTVDAVVTAVAGAPGGVLVAETVLPALGPRLVTAATAEGDTLRVTARVDVGESSAGSVAAFAVCVRDAEAVDDGGTGFRDTSVTGPIQEFAAVHRLPRMPRRVRIAALARPVHGGPALPCVRVVTLHDGPPWPAPRRPVPARPGDRVTAGGDLVEVPSGPEVSRGVSIQPGQPARLPATDGTDRGAWRWDLVAAEESEGPLRLWIDGRIALETFVRRGPDAGRPEGRSGTFDARFLPPAAARVEVEADVPGMEALVLSRALSLDSLSPALAAVGASVAAPFPATLREGEEFDAHVALVTPAGLDQAVVHWSLPAGVEPAEPLAALRRERGPSRCEHRPGEIVLRMESLPGGPQALRLHLRAARAGSYGVPPTVLSGPRGAIAWSAGTRVTIVRADDPATPAPTMRR